MKYDNERSILEYAKEGAEKLGVSINTFLLLKIANYLDEYQYFFTPDDETPDN